jgi:hypothetical protein
MVRKFPDKQYNRQSSILFHETLPLHLTNTGKALLYLIVSHEIVHPSHRYCADLFLS